MKINKYVIISAVRRIRSLFKRYSITRDPLLIMTILVRDEIDIIEDNLRFHKLMGVDGFIVTDNGSTDGTSEILKTYYEKGWIKKIIFEPKLTYAQDIWVDRMVKYAKHTLKADWVINADADEFWYSKAGSLKESINSTRKNVLKCDIKNIIPLADNKYWKNNLLVQKPVSSLQQGKLSRFSLYGPQIPKVLHRTEDYVKIHVGNHNVEMKITNKGICQDILIYHYSIRGYEHFMRKVINGGSALRYNENLKMGNHWRYLYSLYEQNNLEGEYEKVIGRKFIDEFKAEKILVEDNTILDILDKW